MHSTTLPPLQPLGNLLNLLVNSKGGRVNSKEFYAKNFFGYKISQNKKERGKCGKNSKNQTINY
ncbi:MAG: hypothetical protein CMM37_13060 [Rhodospirillaceae bacterium]|nr:hypothetical protein [Rhodospirillaceae bacterium]